MRAYRAVHLLLGESHGQGAAVFHGLPLRDGGYQGYGSVEHHSGKDECAGVAIQLAKVHAVLQGWRKG